MNIASYIRILRPTQWLKNLMLYFPPFLAGTLLDPGVAVRGGAPVLAFCLASSATYVLNDIFDARNDSLHNIKRFRPIPSGKISRSSAFFFCIFIASGSVFLALLVSKSFLLLLLTYLAISSLYSIKLKEYAVVDLFCISAGFLLRLRAGGEAFAIPISEWLFLSVFLLAIFLSTGKRLCEKNTMGELSGRHRKSLLSYPEGFLDGIMYMTGGSVLVTYSMYVISRHVLLYTVPLCAFGLMRYMFLVKSGIYGDPTESLVKDRGLFWVGFCWTLMIGWGIYSRY